MVLLLLVPMAAIGWKAGRSVRTLTAGSFVLGLCLAGAVLLCFRAADMSPDAALKDGGELVDLIKAYLTVVSVATWLQFVIGGGAHVLWRKASGQVGRGLSLLFAALLLALTLAPLGQLQNRTMRWASEHDHLPGLEGR
ncbi:hypothetical protein [Azospirillum sp. B4]|uniref:hypothetical protein n=1 Tax=Azospirillum sp. B4 TaxID=95605 RepID=UPI0005CA8EEA|nr:hypothetical protein [Azospirillum sp. B4]